MNVWLHGFASAPSSSKARFVGERLAERGEELVVPDLNQPDFFGLTVSRMLGQLELLIEKARPVVLFGSSLGGFTAATYAARHPRSVEKLILLAPAFDLAARWEARMGVEAERWRREGKFAFDHHARGRKEDLSYEFLRDARKYEPFPIPDCPTLVVQGLRDDVVDPALAREFVSRAGGRPELVEVDEGHELTADLPALWKKIAAFLDVSR